MEREQEAQRLDAMQKDDLERESRRQENMRAMEGL